MEQIICAYCKQPFTRTTKRPSAHCSPWCGRAAFNQLRRERTRKRRPSELICAHCGMVFTRPINAPIGKCCSKKCARLLRYHSYYKETELKRSAEWRRDNPDKMKACKEDWYRRNKRKSMETHKNWQLKNDYGITLEEYDAECAKRENKCDICHKDPGPRKLRVDHNHKTGELRGYLCDRCNHVLGHSLDEPETLIAASLYLHKQK